MDVSKLYHQEQHGRSIFTVDWIGNPSPIDIRTGSASVDLYIGSKGTDRDPKRVPVTFEKLASLRAPGHGFPRRDWLPPRLLSRGQHYILSIAPHAAITRTLEQVSQALANSCELIAAEGIPIHGRANVASQAQASSVAAIPDSFGFDPYFCIIPCMEVVRHFFCTSSNLAKQLLYGWEDLIVWDKTYRASHLNEIFLTLSRALNNLPTEIPALTQYAFSPHWRQTADSVRKRLQRVNSAAPIQPFGCAFPLTLRCQISVEAIALPANTKLGHRFFVTRLVSTPLEVAADVCWVYFEEKARKHNAASKGFEVWTGRGSAFGKGWQQLPNITPVLRGLS